MIDNANKSKIFFSNNELTIFFSSGCANDMLGPNKIKQARAKPNLQSRIVPDNYNSMKNKNRAKSH